jgi:heterodisulfide reductase subunit C
MTTSIRLGGPPSELMQQVERLSGQSLAACYQCGTCTATCPFSAAMEVQPDALIGRLRFGLPDVLEPNTCWVCVGCEACTVRCPRAIDVARVMAALRQIQLQSTGDRLALAQLSAATLRELPPIALVASTRRNTG